MEYVVYQITHRVSKKYYIGKTTLAKWQEGYMGSGIHIKRAVRKHGRKAFYRGIISTHNTEAGAFDKEEACIDCTDPMSYNLQSGGRGGSVGRVFTEETRAKMSASSKGQKGFLGRTHTPEERKRMSERQKGKTIPPETRAKISKANTGAGNSFYGKTHTPETRRRISKAKKGIPVSPEARINMSLAQKGKVLTPEHRAKISASKKGRGNGRTGMPMSAETKAKISATRKAQFIASQASP